MPHLAYLVLWQKQKEHFKGEYIISPLAPNFTDINCYYAILFKWDDYFTIITA